MKELDSYISKKDQYKIVYNFKEKTSTPGACGLIITAPSNLKVTTIYRRKNIIIEEY